MQLARALLNPARIRILDAVAGGPASPGELAATLEESPSVVSYHVGVLRATGCLQPTGTVQAGRGSERSYEAVSAATPIGRLAPLQAIPPVLGHPPAAALRAIIDREIADFGAGTPGVQGDRLSCASVVLDQRGWREVSAAIGGVLDRVSVAQEESAQRLAGTDEEGISATIAVGGFESKPRDEAGS